MLANAITPAHTTAEVATTSAATALRAVLPSRAARTSVALMRLVAWVKAYWSMWISPGVDECFVC
jgi:hypothetical protein